MERLGEAVGAFLQFDLRADGWPAYTVFVVTSGLIGLAIVLLDACSVALRQDRDSSLGLTHGPRATPKAALVWVIGSMLGAGLGLLPRVVEPTPLAAVLVSLTWRTLLSRLKERAAHHERQKPGGD